MDALQYVNDYLDKNGSADPELEKKARHTCADYAVKNLILTNEESRRDAEKLREAGNLYGYLNLNADALKFYEQALKIKPDDLNLIHCKSFTLCRRGDAQKVIDFIEPVFNRLAIDYSDEKYCEIAISYLSALSTQNIVNSEKFKQTLDNLLAHHHDNNYTHIFAVRYHAPKDNDVKVLQHLAKIVELLNTDENERPLCELTDDFNSILASAVELAIRYGDKNKTWLFIGRLMNSEHDHDEVLKLRELAAKAFPMNKNNDLNRSL